MKPKANYGGVRTLARLTTGNLQLVFDAHSDHQHVVQGSNELPPEPPGG